MVCNHGLKWINALARCALTLSAILCSDQCMHNRITALLAAFVFSVSALPVAAGPDAWRMPAPEELQRFYTAFSQAKKKPVGQRRWRGADSPFAPYLKQPFTDGLSPAERTLSDAAAARADCRTVAALDLIGFQRLYPQLAPAWLADEMHDVFRDHVQRGSLASLRCRAWQDYIGVVLRYRQSEPVLSGLALERGLINWPEDSDVPSGTDRAEYTRAIRVLFALAFCENVLPAAADLLTLHKNGTVLLPDNERSLLAALAQLAGLPLRPSEAELAGRVLSNQVRRAQLTRVRHEPQMVAALLPDWHSPCGKTVLSRGRE